MPSKAHFVRYSLIGIVLIEHHPYQVRLRGDDEVFAMSTQWTTVFVPRVERSEIALWDVVCLPRSNVASRFARPDPIRTAMLASASRARLTSPA
jgi:hypothetical protein